MTTEETRKLFESLIKDRKQIGKEKPNNVTQKQSKMVENLERSLTKDDPLVEGNIYNGEAEKNLKNLRNSENGKGKENKDTETNVQLENDSTDIDGESVKSLKRKRNKSLKNLSPSSGGRSSKSQREREAFTPQFRQPFATEGLDYPCAKIPEKSNETPVKFEIATSKTSRPPRYSPVEMNKFETRNKAKQRGPAQFVVTPESMVGKHLPNIKSEGKKLRFLQDDRTPHDRRHGRKKNTHEKSMDGSTTKSSKQLASTNNLNKDGMKSFPKKKFEKHSSFRRAATKKSKQVENQATLPIKITVENVDSLVNVFKTIWSKHSSEIVAGDRQPGPVKITLENVDSNSNIRKILWVRENDSPDNISRKDHLSGRSKKITRVWKADSEESCPPQFEYPKIVVENVDSEPNIQRTLWDGYSRPIKIVLESVDSEPNVYKTIWESLSKEFFDDSSSLKTLWEEESDIMLSKSFDSVETILLTSDASDSISSDYIGVDDEHRIRFWQKFWLKAGVKISLTCLDNLDGSYIQSKDGTPKKTVRKKKSEVKSENLKKENLQENEQKRSGEDTLPVKKARGPRKKRRPELNESTTMNEANEIPRPVPTPRKSPENIPTPIPQDEVDEETTPKTTVRKTRRRKKRTPGTQTPSDGAQENVEAAATIETSASIGADIRQEEFRDDGTILGVTVHYCDHLRADLRYVAHPLVKVAVVDALSGKHLSKFDSTRHVSSFYETDSVGYILPLMTQPFDFKQNRSLLPRWEEILVFNESFSKLSHPGTEPTATKPILFFVIRDFITMAKANNKKGGPDKGWYNIAWAFLKLINANHEPNVGRKMRLQLFYPPRNRNAAQDPSMEIAYDWWLNHPRQKYPSTLYVTVKAVVPPAGIGPAPRSMFAMQPEEGALTFNEMRQSLEQAETSRKSEADEDELALMKLWSRVPGQTCKIPNAPFLRFWGGSEGTFALRFSHKGIRLAAACRHESTYPIILFSIPGGEEIAVITGHQQLVYSLEWSNNDRYLLSASADGTAQVWDMERREKPIQTLPHPCYVYTASYHPIAQHIIASGGYDSILRVWNIASVTSQLTQELNGHKAFINSIIFDQTGLTMYSADGAGVIICWHSKANGKAKKNAKTNWAIKTRIADEDLIGTCINSMSLHTHNNKILVHCRDSSVYILDTRIHSLRKFTGLINNRQYIRSCLTPCGTFIFSGSEDGCIYVWNVEAGDQVAIYNELGYTSAVHAVVYHPHDHMIACCSYAPNQSILLYKFNSTVATMEAGYNAGPGESLDNKERTTLVPDIDSQIEATKSAVKLSRIKQKLDSVLSDTESIPEGNHYINVINDSPNEKTESLSFEARNPVLPSTQRERDQLITPIKSPRSANQSPRTNTGYDPLSTWGSTFDSTTQGESFLEPSYLSPHASPGARALAQQYSRSGRLPDGGGQWRPNVASVGGSPYREQPSGIPPDVSFSIDKDGNRSLSVTSTPKAQQQSVVVVLYDYQANRSDELSIFRGDVIRVFYKDSPSWWFGERTSDGKQGYFPSSYVQEQESTSTLDKSTEQPELFGVPESSSMKKIHAFKMPGGRLQFYSQSESEGDDERLSTSSRQRRRDARLKPVTENLTNGSHGVSESLPSSTLARDETLPKSILHKSSPRPKIVVQAPSMENTVPKEVSFADEPKKVPSQKSKADLIEAIASTIESTGVQLDRQPARSESVREKPTQRKRVKAKEKPVRSASVKQVKSSSMEDTTGSHSSTKKPEQIQKPATPTPTFGILKSIEALMREDKHETSFSKSVLGGHEMETPKMQPKSKEDFRPTVHSTAVKNMNTRPTSSEGSFIKKSRPLPKARKLPEDSVPMIELSSLKEGRSSPSGRTNLAFDASP